MDRLEEHIKSRIYIYEKELEKYNMYTDKDSKYYSLKGSIGAYKNVLKWKKSYDKLELVEANNVNNNGKDA